MAARPARPPSRPGVPGSGGARPADAGRATSSCTGCPRCPRRKAAVRTPAAVPQRHRTADTAAVSGSAATRAPPAGRGVRGGPRPAATGLRRTRSPRSSTPAAAAHFVPPTRPRWPTGTGRRRRRTPAVRTRGQRTRLANTGSPQPPDPADTRHCGRGHAATAAAAPLDSRQRNHPPPHAYPAGTAAALDLHSARERWRSGEGARRDASPCPAGFA